MKRIQNLVNEERKSLLEGKDGIQDAVITRPKRSQTVAVGLLALDDIEAATDWFQALTEEWLIYADNMYDSQYRSDPKKSAQLGPWSDYINAIYCAVLAQNDVESTAETVHERATEPFIEDLENRSLAHRIDLARALSSYILANGELETHVETLEANVRDQDKPWAVDRYLPYARVLRGLDEGDTAAVSAGLDGLLEFHRNRVAGVRDADAVTKAVALDATAMVALARRDGLDISIDHDAIPDAVNDDDHYPIGE